MHANRLRSRSISCDSIPFASADWQATVTCTIETSHSHRDVTVLTNCGVDLSPWESMSPFGDPSLIFKFVSSFELNFARSFLLLRSSARMPSCSIVIRLLRCQSLLSHRSSARNCTTRTYGHRHFPLRGSSIRSICSTSARFGEVSDSPVDPPSRQKFQFLPGWSNEAIGWPEEDLTSTYEEGGGFYPVCLGETFDEGRFVITRKLGWGRHSSVWLARDCKYVRKQYISHDTSQF